MAVYTITTGLAASMKAAFEIELKLVNNTVDRQAVVDAFQALVDLLFVEFTAIDAGDAA